MLLIAHRQHKSWGTIYKDVGEKNCVCKVHIVNIFI